MKQHDTDYLIISIGAFSEINRKVFYEMADMGKKIVLVFPRYLTFSSGVKECEEPKSNKVIAVALNKVFDNPRITYYKGLKELIKQHNPQFVYTEYDPASLLAVILSIWSKKLDFKLICHSCENMELGMFDIYNREGIRGLLPGAMKNLFLLLVKNRIFHVFTLGLDGQRIFKNLGFKSVSLNHLGFDETIFKPDNQQRIGIRSKLNLNKPVIAYFGRMIPEKGVHILINALSKIKDRNWIFLLDSFGRYKNPYQEKLEALISINELQDRTVFFDADHFEIASYMNAADIVVIPSITSKKWKEQMGRVAPEAMACGKTIIVSDSGTLKELVPNPNQITKEQNVEELANKIIYFLDNPFENEKLANLCLKHTYQRFTIKHQARNILELEKSNPNLIDSWE